jgi:putative ABC transport system ATP-binding protein
VNQQEAAPANGSPVVEVHDLGRRAPGEERWLLSEVSLQILRGERLALVGPTGSGKTLLLRCLALLDPVDQGAILWHGQPVVRVPEYRSRVTYLHQRPALLEGDVEANLRLPFTLSVHRGRHFDRDRVLAILGALNRGASFLTRSQADLSGGENQLVALIRAIQFDPEVLLLDEPTAALDQESVTTIEQLLQRWWEEGRGVRSLVWVSHSPEQVARVADRRLNIRNGRLEGMG